MSAIETEYKQVQADLKLVGDQLKSFAEQSQTEIRNASALHAETKVRVDELLTKQGELNARLQAAEQHMVSLDTAGHDRHAKSLGQFVAGEETMSALAGLQNGKGSHTVSASVSEIDSGAGSGGELLQPLRVPGVVAPPNRRLTIRDLLSWGQVSGTNSIEYVVETGFANSADVVSENPALGKPQSGITMNTLSAPIVTIAHWIHATKQILSDASMLASYIDQRLRFGLKLKEELQLLKGSGVGLNINGLYTQASAYANPGVAVKSETMIDRLRLAMLQVQLAEYTADGIVINPVDWADIELTKDDQSRYVFANVTSLAGPTLWGLPVVATQSMDVGDFMTGAFRMGAQGWDREMVNVSISTEDRDNFIKNMVTVLCEERVGLTVYRPEAFVKGDFAGASSAG